MVLGSNYFLGEYSNFGGLQVAPRSPFRANLFDSIRHDWRENLQSPKKNTITDEHQKYFVILSC